MRWALLIKDHILPPPRCLYGGAGRQTQIMQIMKAPHIVVATPGRLIDFAEGGELDLTKVRGRGGKMSGDQFEAVSLIS